ncbi:MAG TPA: hypothetical protein VH306_10225 [Gaiellaceae bacterium]
MRESSRVQNEKVFRAANQAIERNRQAVESANGELLVFLCECSDEACRVDVELTREEYGQVRAGNLRFLVASGHADPLERVLDEFDRYTVVEK